MSCKLGCGADGGKGARRRGRGTLLYAYEYTNYCLSPVILANRRPHFPRLSNFALTFSPLTFGKLASSTLLTITYRPGFRDAQTSYLINELCRADQDPYEALGRKAIERQLNSLVLLQQPQRGFCEQGQRNDGQRPGLFPFITTPVASFVGSRANTAAWSMDIRIRWFVSIAHLSLLIKVTPGLFRLQLLRQDNDSKSTDPTSLFSGMRKRLPRPANRLTVCQRNTTLFAADKMPTFKGTDERLSRFAWRGSLNQPLARNKAVMVRPYTGRSSKQAAAVLRVALFRRHGTYPIDATLVYSASPQSHTAAASTSTQDAEANTSTGPYSIYTGPYAPTGNRNGNGFFPFEQLKADDAGATGVDIRREGHSAALRMTRWFYQPGLVTQILGALMQALWGHTRVPPQGIFRMIPNVLYLQRGEQD
ncbi:hypothetical protein CCUS01_16734 [Colletotrichum cuscutae]|uniref:Uncharacterized protein n=1 Tax=Colletotrichum cuscutae TaxID=1209917 RepID=A0AAI9VC11_9PEZI|nr:hypothetical protein CCUS01_16734 [Colletotrichum cuscutae]